jgi:arylsulfatase A-like enzyme
LKAGEFNAPVHIADWMPTLCAVAGHQPDADLKWDGINVWPLLTGEAKPAERALYWTGPGFRCRALRQGNWKLVVTKGGTATVELFDLTTDPNEQTDLAARQPDRVKALQQRMEAIAAADNTAPVKPTR